MKRNGKWNATTRCPGCALAGQRLLINQERQRAAAARPGPGSHGGTYRHWGVFDLVGNPELNLAAARARALTHFIWFPL